MTAPFTYPPGSIVYADGSYQGDGSDDFPCCTPAVQAAERAPLNTAGHAEQVRRIAQWIAPTLLDRFPNGPYAVYAYYPRTGREVVTRNQTADSAVDLAESDAARGCDVHVSLDTCG